MRCTQTYAALLSILLTAVTIPASGQDAPGELPSKLDPGDGAPGDFFACALDLTRSAEGDLTAVVGSLLDDDRGPDSGSAYVFERRRDGWVRTTKLLGSGSQAGDELGFAVGIDGGLLALGAPKAAPAGGFSGSVWTFRRIRGEWVEEARLVPEALAPFDQLGHAVAVSRNTVAAGAPGDDGGGPATGAAWVFEEAGAVRLTGAVGPGAGLGFSVALDGEVLIAGAPFDNSSGAGTGAAWVFERIAGAWTGTAKLTAEAARPASLFGSSVAVSGNRVAVGAPMEDGDGSNAGAVYVFRRTGTGWIQEARLTPGGLSPGDEFGVSVSLDGGVLAVGARFDDTIAPDAGSIHVFRLEGGRWTEGEIRTDPGSGPGDELGFAVAVQGEAVLGGAYRADSAGADSGLACAFGDEPPPPPTPPPLQPRLALVKTSDRGVVASGGEIGYTVIVNNSGTAGTTARVRDVFPQGLACTWTCAASQNATCTQGLAQGDIDDPVTLPAGSSVTYDIDCSVSPDLTEPVTNEALVTSPGGDRARDVTTALPVAFIPTLSEISLLLLALLLAGFGVRRLAG